MFTLAQHLCVWAPIIVCLLNVKRGVAYMDLDLTSLRWLGQSSLWGTTPEAGFVGI